MHACFVRGCDWICGHREPELAAWEVRILKTAEAIERRAADREASISRKPPASAPVVSIREKQAK